MRKERKVGVFGRLEEGEGKESYGPWREYGADGVIYSPKWGRRVGCGALVRLLSLSLIKRSVWVKRRKMNRQIPVVWMGR